VGNPLEHKCIERIGFSTLNKFDKPYIKNTRFFLGVALVDKSGSFAVPIFKDEN
jgi:hypothetical protein